MKHHYHRKYPKIYQKYDFNFCNNKKYHYIAATKPNALLAKFLSNHDGDKFCLNYFVNFENEELIKKHKKFFENIIYIDRNPQKTFKTIK